MENSIFSFNFLKTNFFVDCLYVQRVGIQKAEAEIAK